MSTLIKKGLLTKSSTVPAKYALTDVGKEMAQKLVNVDSTCVQQPSSSPPQHPPASQETEEVLEARLPRPWLLHQEDGNSGQLSNKQTSISRKKKKISEKELPPAVLHPFPSNSIPSPSYSDSDDSELLPGDYILNGFSQSSRLRYDMYCCLHRCKTCLLVLVGTVPSSGMLTMMVTLYMRKTKLPFCLTVSSTKLCTLYIMCIVSMWFVCMLGVCV